MKGKWCHIPLDRNLLFKCLVPVGVYYTEVCNGFANKRHRQCDAKSTVTFPAADVTTH